VVVVVVVAVAVAVAAAEAAAAAAGVVAVVVVAVVVVFMKLSPSCRSWDCLTHDLFVTGFVKLHLKRERTWSNQAGCQIRNTMGAADFSAGPCRSV
jgi:hypothetical protein